jgi:putative IMPACT (imprinted ancient) family translation regulator
MIGEPSGTAGAPMLSILKKKELLNVLVVVTRYFGGILLGTGGLVRAYSDALNASLINAGEINKEFGYLVEAIIEYERQNEFEKKLEKNNISIVSKEYTDKIKYIIEISQKKYEEIFDEKQEIGKIRKKENKYVNA